MVLVKEVEMMAEEVAEEKKVVDVKEVAEEKEVADEKKVAEVKVDRCPPDFLWKWVVEPV